MALLGGLPYHGRAARNFRTVVYWTSFARRLILTCTQTYTRMFGGGVSKKREDHAWNEESISRLGLGRTADGPNALHPGDEITVTVVPALDGKSPVGLLVAITYPDGHTVRFRSPDE